MTPFTRANRSPCPNTTLTVECFARDYAAAAGLSDGPIDDRGLAGWLHDVGKADRRFQILLRGGSEIAFFKDERPWAKSGMPPGAKGAHRLAQKNSRYPKGARHEVQSGGDDRGERRHRAGEGA